jgi:hypothetical protein
MSLVEYQRYTLSQLISRLGASSWANLALTILVLAISLLTESCTWTQGIFYGLLAVITFFRLRFWKQAASRNYQTLSLAEIKKDNDYFTILIGGTGLCWSLILLSPVFCEINSASWNQFAYFLGTGLLCSGLFNIGISKRNFMVFCVPILAALSISGIFSQPNWWTQVAFFLTCVLFFFFIKTLQTKTEEFYFEIYNRQQDMFQVLEGFPGAISLIEGDKLLYLNQKLISLIDPKTPLQKGDTLDKQYINPHLVKKIKSFQNSNLTEEEFEMDLQTTSGRKSFWVLLKKLQENKMMVLGIDIDDKRRNERKIAEQNVRLIESSKMASLGEMSSGIAHEINNPLTIIQGSTRQLNRIGSKINGDLQVELEKH